MRGKLPARDFTPLLKRFPVDWKGVPAMETAIENSLQSKNPVETLATIGKTLRKKKKVWNNLTIESRRQIVGLEITVGALRRLAALESMETSVEELKPLGQEWKDLGGSVPPSRFGPRVEVVFRKLLR